MTLTRWLPWSGEPRRTSAFPHDKAPTDIQRREATSLRVPRQWEDSLVFHFLESRPRRVESSPGRKPARMLAGMSWRVTSDINGEDSLERKSGRRERRGSQKVRLRKDCRRAPRSRRASPEKWCRMRLPTQASASIFGRV